jgi:PAS domain-containing protein
VIETGEIASVPPAMDSDGRAGAEMPQQQVEVILVRQLASYLTIPIFVVGMDENLIYYNDAAGNLLGRRFDEAGEMPLTDLPGKFKILAEDGTPLSIQDMPITAAVRERRPEHLRLRYESLDGVQRTIEVTAFPLEGQGGRQLGAVAIFWEAPGA